jgi:RNA polymerase-binding transcription factor DksA
MVAPEPRSVLQMALTDEQKARLKGKLSKKGQELAEMLADVLAGNVPAALAALADKPGEKPEEKLRRYLDKIQGMMRALREGGYGRCEVCGTEIPFAELDEMPWADTCGECASKGLAKL